MNACRKKEEESAQLGLSSRASLLVGSHQEKKRKDIVSVERIHVTSSSLSVVVEAWRPRLPVRDLSFFKDARMITLDYYFSELDDENTADSLWDGERV